MNEQAQLRQLFERLGAPSAQAEVMATQMLKTARRTASERTCTEVEALAYFIRKTIAARRGESLEDELPGKPLPAPERHGERISEQ